MANEPITYELIQVDVFALAADGSDDPLGAWLMVSLPQELSATPTVEEGERVKERAAGILAVDIKEPDQVIGGELGFKNLAIDAESFECMFGGTILTDTESPPNIIGYDDPEAGEVSPLFKMRAYAERYVDNNLDGYQKLDFPKCMATAPEYTLGQQTVAVPSMTITAYPNANADGDVTAWRGTKKVEALGD